MAILILYEGICGLVLFLSGTGGEIFAEGELLALRAEEQRLFCLLCHYGCWSMVEIDVIGSYLLQLLLYLIFVHSALVLKLIIAILGQNKKVHSIITIGIAGFAAILIFPDLMFLPYS
jgi:hypothetical protein